VHWHKTAELRFEVETNFFAESIRRVRVLFNSFIKCSQFYSVSCVLLASFIIIVLSWIFQQYVVSFFLFSLHRFNYVNSVCETRSPFYVTVFLKLIYISSFLSVLPFLISFLSPRHQSKRDALSRTKNISANFFFFNAKTTSQSPAYGFWSRYLLVWDRRANNQKLSFYQFSYFSPSLKCGGNMENKANKPTALTSAFSAQIKKQFFYSELIYFICTIKTLIIV